MKVVLTAAAERDLVAIGEYIARDNPARAVSFTAELVSLCEQLAHRAHIFPIVRPFAELGIRRRRRGAYMIFYRLDGDLVQVLRILHGAQKWEDLLEL